MGVWRRARKTFGIIALIGFILWILPAILQHFFSNSKIDIFLYSFVTGGVIVGFLVYKISYYQWTYNSLDEDAILIKGQWYKAVKVDTPRSWRMALKHISYTDTKGETIELFDQSYKDLRHSREEFLEVFSGFFEELNNYPESE